MVTICIKEGLVLVLSVDVGSSDSTSDAVEVSTTNGKGSICFSVENSSSCTGTSAGSNGMGILIVVAIITSLCRSNGFVVKSSVVGLLTREHQASGHWGLDLSLQRIRLRLFVGLLPRE